MSPITTHVLDTARGQPAAGIAVLLEQCDGSWREIGRGVTDADGRCRTLLLDSHTLAAGQYRLTFETRPYFEAQRVSAFYPAVSVLFEVREPGQHYHVPLLLSPFGYSTYRGS